MDSSLCLVCKIVLRTELRLNILATLRMCAAFTFSQSRIMLKVNFRRIDSREKKHVIGEFNKSRSWPRKVLLR